MELWAHNESIYWESGEKVTFRSLDKQQQTKVSVLRIIFLFFLHNFSSFSTLEIKYGSTVICAYSNYANLSYGTVCTIEKLWNGLRDVIPTVITWWDGNHDRTFQIEIFIQGANMNLSSWKLVYTYFTWHTSILPSITFFRALCTVKFAAQSLVIRLWAWDSTNVYWKFFRFSQLRGVRRLWRFQRLLREFWGKTGCYSQTVYPQAYWTSICLWAASICPSDAGFLLVVWCAFSVIRQWSQQLLKDHNTAYVQRGPEYKLSEHW